MQKHTRRRLVQMSAAIMVLSAAPMAFASTGVQTNDACAQDPITDKGTCCPGTGTCVIGNYIEHNAYYKSDGAC